MNKLLTFLIYFVSIFFSVTIFNMFIFDKTFDLLGNLIFSIVFTLLFLGLKGADNKKSE